MSNGAFADQANRCRTAAQTGNLCGELMLAPRGWTLATWLGNFRR
jgi:hypothetical protein